MRLQPLVLAFTVAMFALSPVSRLHADTPAPKTTAEPKAGQVDLRPRWEKGQTLRYRMVQDSKATMPNPLDPKTKTESKTAQAVEFSLKTTNVTADGVATVEMVYDTMKVSIESGEMTITYDSQKNKPASTTPGKAAPGKQPSPTRKSEGELDDLIAPIFDGIVGSKLTLTIDREGNITEVQGGESLNALSSLSSLTGGAGGAGGAVSPKGMPGLFGSINGSKSAGLYRVGEKWTNTESLSVGPLGNFKMITQYVLSSHSGGRAQVTISGKAEANSQSDADTSADKIKLRHSAYKGSYTWDTAKGRLVSLELEQSLAIGGQIEASTSGTTKITLIK